MTFEDGRSAAAEGAAGGAALSGAGAAALAEGASPFARSLNRATTGLASMKRVISGFHENTEFVAKKEGAYKFMKGIKKVAHGTKYLRTGFLAGSSAAVMTHIQLLLLTGWGLTVPLELPPYLSWIGLLTLDTSFLRFACTAPHAYFDLLVGTLLVAVVLPAAAAAAYGIAAAVRCCTGGSRVRLLRYQSRCVMCAVTLLVILYAPVASVVVRYFGCAHYGEYDLATGAKRWRLVVDPAFFCDEGVHAQFRPLAITAAALFVCGLPVAALSPSGFIASVVRTVHALGVRSHLPQVPEAVLVLGVRRDLQASLLRLDGRAVPRLPGRAMRAWSDRRWRRRPPPRPLPPVPQAASVFDRVDVRAVHCLALARRTAVHRRRPRYLHGDRPGRRRYHHRADDRLSTSPYSSLSSAPSSSSLRRRWVCCCEWPRSAGRSRRRAIPTRTPSGAIPSAQNLPNPAAALRSGGRRRRRPCPPSPTVAARRRARRGADR